MMIHFCPKRYNRVVIFVIHLIFEIYSTDQDTVVENVPVDLVCIITRTFRYNSRYLGEIGNDWCFVFLLIQLPNSISYCIFLVLCFRTLNRICITSKRVNKDLTIRTKQVCHIWQWELDLQRVLMNQALTLLVKCVKIYGHRCQRQLFGEVLSLIEYVS